MLDRGEARVSELSELLDDFLGKWTAGRIVVLWIVCVALTWILTTIAATVIEESLDSKGSEAFGCGCAAFLPIVFALVVSIAWLVR